MANDMTKADWERKDKIIVCQNALSHATQIVCSGGITAGEINISVDRIKDIASRLVDWVYEKSSESGTVSTVVPVPTPAQKKILDKFENKYKIKKEEILKKWGHYPLDEEEALKCLNKIQSK
jgi:hypothetical protein